MCNPNHVLIVNGEPFTEVAEAADYEAELRAKGQDVDVLEVDQADQS